MGMAWGCDCLVTKMVHTVARSKSAEMKIDLHGKPRWNCSITEMAWTRSEIFELDVFDENRPWLNSAVINFESDTELINVRNTGGVEVILPRSWLRHFCTVKCLMYQMFVTKPSLKRNSTRDLCCVRMSNGFSAQLPLCWFLPNIYRALVDALSLEDIVALVSGRTYCAAQ